MSVHLPKDSPTWQLNGKKKLLINKLHSPITPITIDTNLHPVTTDNILQ